MNVEEYIASGILELYVAGALSEKENQEVYEAMQQHPEILAEVLKIEEAVVKLTASVGPIAADQHWEHLNEKLNSDGKIRSLDHRQTIHWSQYLGWAAAVLFATGLFWYVNKASKLSDELEQVTIEKQEIEFRIEKAVIDLKEAEKLVEVLRDRNILSVPLGGQAVAPDAYANVYWDKASNKIYLDAKGLPEPPEGKVYQVWSLTLDPLAPTSLGTVDTFTTDDNKIFEIENANASEAFGITLEPAGGSESPTLEQLYTLGTVEPTP